MALIKQEILFYIGFFFYFATGNIASSMDILTFTTDILLTQNIFVLINIRKISWM